MSLRLIVTAGPDQGLALALNPGEPVLLGRSKDNAARLTDPHVSRLHCQVQLEGNRVVVLDCGSTPGTRVNGARVAEVELRPGDVLQIGETDLRLQGELVPRPEASDEDRLSRIETHWTMLWQAHAANAAHAGDSGGMGHETQTLAKLLRRYCGAVYRYLLGAVGDPDLAGDLAQEFALRFLRGDFRRADPKRGRFRAYLKAALAHLIADYFRSVQQAPQLLSTAALDRAAPAEASTDSHQDFLPSWRDELLQRTWKALADDNSAYHAVLRCRIDNPDMSSTQMAEHLAGLLGKPVTSAWVRKNLQRAQEKFADLLIEEVATSLQEATPDQVRRELQELDLLKFCEPALEKWDRRHRDSGNVSPT